jgi:Zn-dependent protease with chaperone function
MAYVSDGRGSLFTVTPNTRTIVVVALFAGLPAVVLGLVALLAGGPIAGAIVLVAVAGALAAWIRLGADRRLLAAIGGRDADAVTDARLFNLVEGLSIGAGVRQPRLRVIDSPGLNAVAGGTTPAKAVLGVTSGLLAELDRVELEAVVAENLVRIRRSDTGPSTLLAATFGVGRRLAVPADRDTAADLGAVGLTRYPPALASALEKLDAKGCAVAGQSAGVADLWLADPTSAAVPARGRTPLPERIEALREL